MQNTASDSESKRCPKCGGELTRVEETDEGWVELTYCALCESDVETRVTNAQVDQDYEVADMTSPPTTSVHPIE